MNEPTCAYCEEPVGKHEQHPAYMQPMHIECHIRQVAGSVAHLERRCSCYILDSDEGDPPGLTKREAAHAAALAFWEPQLRQGKLPCR